MTRNTQPDNGQHWATGLRAVLKTLRLPIEVDQGGIIWVGPVKARGLAFRLRDDLWKRERAKVIELPPDDLVYLAVIPTASRVDASSLPCMILTFQADVREWVSRHYAEIRQQCPLGIVTDDAIDQHGGIPGPSAHLPEVLAAFGCTPTDL